MFDDCGGRRWEWLCTMVVELDTVGSRWQVHNVSVTLGGHTFVCLGQEWEGSIRWLGSKWLLPVVVVGRFKARVGGCGHKP